MVTFPLPTSQFRVQLERTMIHCWTHPLVDTPWTAVSGTSEVDTFFSTLDSASRDSAGTTESLSLSIYPTLILPLSLSLPSFLCWSLISLQCFHSSLFGQDITPAAPPALPSFVLDHSQFSTRWARLMGSVGPENSLQEKSCGFSLLWDLLSFQSGWSMFKEVIFISNSVFEFLTWWLFSVAQALSSTSCRVVSKHWGSCSCGSLSYILTFRAVVWLESHFLKQTCENMSVCSAFMTLTLLVQIQDVLYFFNTSMTFKAT